jgi:hypothetical protein
MEKSCSFNRFFFSVQGTIRPNHCTVSSVNGATHFDIIARSLDCSVVFGITYDGQTPLTEQSQVLTLGL